MQRAEIVRHRYMQQLSKKAIESKKRKAKERAANAARAAKEKAAAATSDKTLQIPVDIL